jgi:uncharacterized protein (DUF1330 family)
MLTLTQLIYLHPGEERAFDEFEAVALRVLASYGGEVLLRLRPTPDSVIAHGIEVPYEVHVIRMPDEDALARFSRDEERQRVLHLKEGAVRASILVKGT